jgi:uncharacterized protein YqjF (DUF2071 family)
MEETAAIVAKPFLTAEWRNLLMANFEADRKVLEKYLPYKTELDSYNGIYYVSLVGFLFKNVKVKGISFPFHRNFEEVNLRFYVRYKENGKWKRGVVFIRELVPKRLITFVANTLYNERYLTLPMKHKWDHSEHGGITIEYKWKTSSEWNFIKAKAEKTTQDVTAGSIEEFITEHYWGYTLGKNNTTSEYQVIHPRWKVYRVMDFSFNCNTRKIYGPDFVEILSQSPKSIFLSEGSPISVMPKTKISM